MDLEKDRFRFADSAKTQRRKVFSASVVAVLDESPACVEVQELTLPTAEEETLASTLGEKKTRTRFSVTWKAEELERTERDHPNGSQAI